MLWIWSRAFGPHSPELSRRSPRRERYRETTRKSDGKVALITASRAGGWGRTETRTEAQSSRISKWQTEEKYWSDYNVTVDSEAVFLFLSRTCYFTHSFFLCNFQSRWICRFCPLRAPMVWMGWSEQQQQRQQDECKDRIELIIQSSWKSMCWHFLLFASVFYYCLFRLLNSSSAEQASLINCSWDCSGFIVTQKICLVLRFIFFKLWIWRLCLAFWHEEVDA